MKNKLLIILLSFILFCVPCFAYDVFPNDNSKYFITYRKSDFSDEFQYIYTFTNYSINSKGTIYMNGYFLYKLANNGDLLLVEEWSGSAGTGGSADRIYFSNLDLPVSFNISSSLYNSNFVKFLNSISSVDMGDVILPPLPAPPVELNLSTESVLLVMIQLTPIILAFLVLYWGFWKAWSMLLNLLHKV